MPGGVSGYPCPGCNWETRLVNYARELLRKYPTQQEQVNKWYNVCRVQFPVYVDYWSKQPDVTARTPLFQELPFDVPYLLPSGRTARLRGKWDAGDLIGPPKTGGSYVQENKTKGEVDEGQLVRQLTFDLQTMIYVVALKTASESPLAKKGWTNAVHGKGVTDLRLPAPVRGVRYNVIRRPLSGGKGSIVRHKPTKSNPAGETEADYYVRLGGIIAENPSEYFWRWKVEVGTNDVEKFRRTCLDPLLENLLDDHEWWEFCRKEGHDPFDGQARTAVFAAHSPRHYRHPFGVRNILDEGGSTDLDEYLSNGSEVGLTRVDDLFPELGGTP